MNEERHNLDPHFDALNLVVSRLLRNHELAGVVLTQNYPPGHWQHVAAILADTTAIGMLSSCGKSAALIMLAGERAALVREREGLER